MAHVAWTDYVAAGGGIALTIRTTDISYTHSSANVTRSWLHRDHLGSTTMVTDAAGAVVQRMSYDGPSGLCAHARFAVARLQGASGATPMAPPIPPAAWKPRACRTAASPITSISKSSAWFT
ncbi:hypothetical protein [Ferrovibrio sp.]|uniref:hypothetical protein n=1 Tax=Ferrovibrio sp. TaxID=1917215 RepID=UPI0025C054AA|nr:hypothetical protein [Ferrovibrio sp.]